MHVQGIAFDFVAEPVHAVFELLAGQHPPGVLQQCLEQRLLAAGQVDRLPGQGRLAAAGVVTQRAVFDHVHRPPGHPPQQGVQASSQLAQVERLEQVVVGAGLQAVHPVGDGIAGGEHQHWQRFALLA